MTSETPCPPQPDPSQTSGGTWHVGTINPGAPQSAAWGSFTFEGSAVYIFGIDQAGQAEIDFALDSTTNPDIHKHQYTGTQQFVYNALFFSATGLSSDQMHTVYWGLKATGNAAQLALLDYAVVTSGEEDIPTTSAVLANPGPATAQTTTGQGQSTGNESQPTGHESQPTGNESQPGGGAGQLRSSSTGSGLTETSTSPSDSELPTGSSHPHPVGRKPRIIGSVVGVVGALIILGAAFIFLRCQRTAARRPSILDDINPESHPALRTSGDVASGTSPEGEDSLTMSRPLLYTPTIPASPSPAVTMRERPKRPSTPNSSNSRAPPAPMIMPAWDPQQDEARQTRDPDMEERVRRLEEELVALRPPPYSQLVASDVNPSPV
ncbi:hypothetical protein MVEN_02196100 [Mycena venus]|uniref:Uncharacterized protein n=1 Tax=Mycena venus TaxID=2733690 RepID=A0A8H6X7I8_9AGAR|nr:hypothetical protein MVEN_02196100 [Mycena venus]